MKFFVIFVIICVMFFSRPRGDRGIDRSRCLRLALNKLLASCWGGLRNLYPTDLLLLLGAFSQHNGQKKWQYSWERY